MRCLVCKQRTMFDQCVRCGRPVCMEHAPMSDRRCELCEIDYTYRPERATAGRWALVGIAAVVVLAILVWPAVPTERGGGFRVITTGFPKLDLVVMSLAGAYFAARLAVGARLAILRRRFLAERPWH